MENCIVLKCFGKSATVYNSENKEITRREGFKTPSFFFIKMPAVLDFWKCNTRGGEIVSKTTQANEFPNITLPEWEKTPTITQIKSKIFVPDWHSPASINCKTGQMLFNARFKTFSFAKQLFIENHEKGHFYYNTEKFCDLFATVQILKMGFGLSQCLEVLRNTLTDSNIKTERYDYVNQMIKNSL